VRRKEFAARVWSKLVLSEKARGLLRRGDRVLAAVSGGPDSVCLAHFLREMSRRKGFELLLAHVHHGLRGREASRDAAFTEGLGRRLGLPAAVLEVSAARRAELRGQGLEDAARSARYEALAREARRLKCNKVATGHQLDDQAETVLLNLLRGTRLSALGGIPPRRPLAKGVTLIRPLLPLSRAEVLEYLRLHALGYRLDRTNLELRFTRNWLRRRILPALAQRQPRVREHLAGLAEQVRGLAEGGAIGGAEGPARGRAKSPGRRRKAPR
jgi:tRNA(Ile)-lysidine synthase